MRIIVAAMQDQLCACGRCYSSLVSIDFDMYTIKYYAANEMHLCVYRRWKIVTIIGCVDTFINEQLRQRFKSKITEDFIFWLSANNKMCFATVRRRRCLRFCRGAAAQSIDVRSVGFSRIAFFFILLRFILSSLLFFIFIKSHPALIVSHVCERASARHCFDTALICILSRDIYLFFCFFFVSFNLRCWPTGHIQFSIAYYGDELRDAIAIYLSNVRACAW